MRRLMLLELLILAILAKVVLAYGQQHRGRAIALTIAGTGVILLLGHAIFIREIFKKGGKKKPPSLPAD